MYLFAHVSRTAWQTCLANSGFTPPLMKHTMSVSQTRQATPVPWASHHYSEVSGAEQAWKGGAMWWLHGGGKKRANQWDKETGFKHKLELIVFTTLCLFNNLFTDVFESYEKEREVSPC